MLIKKSEAKPVWNKTAIRSIKCKVPPSGPWDGYFYQGPTLDFGHAPNPKKIKS